MSKTQYLWCDQFCHPDWTTHGYVSWGVPVKEGWILIDLCTAERFLVVRIEPASDKMQKNWPDHQWVLYTRNLEPLTAAELDAFRVKMGFDSNQCDQEKPPSLLRHSCMAHFDPMKHGGIGVDMDKFRLLEEADKGGDVLGVTPINSQADGSFVFVIWSRGMAYFPSSDIMEVEMEEGEFSPVRHGLESLPNHFAFGFETGIEPFWAKTEKVEFCEPRCRSRRISAAMRDKKSVKVTLRKVKIPDLSA